MTTGKKTISADTNNNLGHNTGHRTALVIGATSSMAQALCRALAARGYGLVLAGRDEGELKLLSQDIRTRSPVPCRTLLLDLMDANLSPELFMEQAGDVDDVIIAAGDMGAADPTDIANIAYTVRINYTVPAQLATAAALKLANKKEGRIVIISSVAGDRGRQSNYAYGSAKAALNAFASGLRNRFCKKGVHVMTVKPGFMDTPMTWEMNSPLIASREYCAGKIIAAMEKNKDVIYVPFFWRFIMLIIIHIPEKIFKRLSL